MTLTTKKDSTDRHYLMNTTKMLENVRCEKDLGVLTDRKLNFDLHIAEGWLLIGQIFLVERTEVEPYDRIAGIERNAVEFYRICCMARSLRSLRRVATLRHGHMARRSASLRSCIQGTRGM